MRNFKQICKFTLVGLGSVIIDGILYRLGMFFLPIFISKAIGFLSGTIYSYLCNKKWTFNWKNKKYNPFKKHLFIYSLSLLLNVSVNKLMLDGFLLQNKNDVNLAFLISTLFSAILNFVGLKYYVFS